MNECQTKPETRNEGKMSMGDLLRRLRKRKGFTLEKMGREIGIARNYVYTMEASKCLIGKRSLERLNRYFGVDLYVLHWMLTTDFTAYPPVVADGIRELLACWEERITPPPLSSLFDLKNGGGAKVQDESNHKGQ